MAKIGKNQPCPCGSGKKYKRCCLGTAQDPGNVISTAIEHPTGTNEAFPPWEPFPIAPGPAAPGEDEELFEDEFIDEFSPDGEFIDDDYDDEDDSHDEYPDEDMQGDGYEDSPAGASGEQADRPGEARAMISDRVPEISAEETALVDAWWDEYRELDDPDDIRAHLEAFFSTHPGLVPNLELHHVVLFELGADYFRRNRHGEYVELLSRIRRDFRDSYLKSFGYYDRDIISYKVMTGRRAEVAGYLDIFREYPAHDPDNLFGVIDFLMANNCQDIVSSLVRDVYRTVITSPDICGGEDILPALVLSFYIPFLRPDFTDGDMEELAARIRSLELPLREEYYRPAFLKQRLQRIFGTYRNWELDARMTNREIYRFYDEVTLNFMGFLHREKGLDWMAAEYFRSLVYDYLVEVIPEGKRPREAFVLTKTTIDRTIARTCQGMIFPDSDRLLGSLNALYWFAGYLEETSTIAAGRRDRIQAWCRGFFEKLYPALEKYFFQARAFKRFPLSAQASPAGGAQKSAMPG